MVDIDTITKPSRMRTDDRNRLRKGLRRGRRPGGGDFDPMTVAVPVQLTTRAPGRSLAGYLVTPALLAAVLLALYTYVSSQTLDSVEERRVNLTFITEATLQHVTLTVVSTILVLLVAIPVGVLLTRPFARSVTPAIVAVFNIGQAIPSIGLLVLFAIGWGIGFWPAVVALVAYSALPVLRNTMIGLTQVDAAVVESGRGMGMSKLGVLTVIELPLAVPVMLEIVRESVTRDASEALLREAVEELIAEALGRHPALQS